MCKIWLKIHFSAFSDVKFNKYESLKTPVLLVVKLLNHFLLLALQCQQNKTDNHSFSQRTKSL